MDEQRIEQVLTLLGKCIPRAPERTVEKMIRTVKELEKMRQGTQDSHEKQLEQPNNKELGDKGISNQGIGGPKI